jgi:hypothetical protein
MKISLSLQRGGRGMSYVDSETETYSVVDVEIVIRRVTADLIMIANSTGAWTRTLRRTVL